MNSFHRSSYWGRWSRVLSTIDGAYVEVNLTPIPCSTETWEDIKPIVIRKHGTGRDKRDVSVDTLPTEVHDAMVKNLGEELTTRLLTEDFLPQIDWRKYNQVCNGGAKLSDIQK